MPLFTIRELAEYEVEAESAQHALALFLANGPGVSEPVKPGPVLERDVFDVDGVWQEVGE